MSIIDIGLVGVGKIACDQHLPAIAEDPRFRLVATADPHARLEGVTGYDSLAALLAGEPGVQAVAICTPTSLRHSQARLALEHGKAVLLEKPPGATLGEVEDLASLAARRGCPLFAAWHSRFAPGVARARAWLADREIRRVEVEWKEDVRVWHPGQAWIWEPSGMGVFDPGINALSILTEILPRPFFLRSARLAVPANRQAPIAADLAFADAEGQAIQAVFDFRQIGPPTWDIRVETSQGELSLTRGGGRLVVDGEVMLDEDEREYPGLYARFAELVAAGESDVDMAPLRHVADACLLGRRETVAAFED